MNIQIIKNHYQSILWGSIFVAQFIVWKLLSHFKVIVDWLFEFFTLQRQCKEKLFDEIPFSVGDIFYLLLIAFVIFLIVKIIKKQKNSLRNLLIFINILFFIYQVSWGMLYFKQTNFSKPDFTKNYETEFVNQLAYKYLKLCNLARENSPENSKKVFEIQDINKLKTEILQSSYKALFPQINDDNSIKPSLFSFAWKYTGIAGYYNPFTSEATYVDGVPNTHIPFSIAHEKTHLFGYAREQEASFGAFLIAQQSDDNSLKYSTYRAVLSYLLNYVTLEVKEDILSKFSPAIQRDIEFENQFWEKHLKYVSSFFSFVNDIFLKSNQQDGEISYSYFILLVLDYECGINPENNNTL